MTNKGAMPQGESAQRFGERLRELRRAAGLDQTELAARVADAGHSLSANGISRLETNNRRADVGDVEALAEALGVSVARLLGLPGMRPDSELADADYCRWRAGALLHEAADWRAGSGPGEQHAALVAEAAVWASLADVALRGETS